MTMSAAVGAVSTVMVLRHAMQSLWILIMCKCR